MIEDNEKSAEFPMVGDVWEINGVPECVILSVNKTTLEYCDQKISYGSGIWEWDLANFLTMPNTYLKRYLCKVVPLNEEPVDWLYNISRTELALGIVKKFKLKMNRDLHEKLESKAHREEIGEYELEFTDNREEMSILYDSDGNSVSIPLCILFELCEKANELSE